MFSIFQSIFTFFFITFVKIYFIHGIDMHWRLLFLVETDIVQFLIPARFFAQYPFLLRFFITVGTEQKSPVFIVNIPKHYRFLIISSSTRQFCPDVAFILQNYSFSLKQPNFPPIFLFAIARNVGRTKKSRRFYATCGTRISINDLSTYQHLSTSFIEQIRLRDSKEKYWSSIIM